VPPWDRCYFGHGGVCGGGKKFKESISDEQNQFVENGNYNSGLFSLCITVVVGKHFYILLFLYNDRIILD